MKTHRTDRTNRIWLALCLFLAAAGLVSAFDVPGKDEGPATAGVEVFNPQFLAEPSVETYSPALGLVYSGGPWQDFLREAGPDWDISLDLRANRPNLVEGQGIPWYPGVGNSLARENSPASGTAAAHPLLTNDRLRNLALAFIESHRELLGVSADTLRFNPDKTVIFDDGAYASVGFDYLYQGIPVEGAEVFFRVNHGNLIQFGTVLVSDVKLDTKPSVGKDAATEAVRRHFEDFGDPRLRISTALDFNFLDDGSLRIIPTLADGGAGETFTGVPGTGYAHRLVWRFVVQVSTGIETWEVWVDAKTGEILQCLDINRYGVVKGGVYPVTNDTSELSEPFPYCWVDNGGTNNRMTNVGGRYAYDPASPAAVQLDGRLANVQSTCGAIDLSTNVVPGDLDFGASTGTNCTTPGVGGAGNTHAARTTFFHVNNVKALARAYLPSVPWLNWNLSCQVDTNATCNAYYNGTLVFYKAGSGCSNTGEIAGVICHEFGHGLDSYDGNGFSPDNGTGEAYADIVSSIETHESCIGNNFTPGYPCPYGCSSSCTGVRDIAVTPPVSPSTITIPPADCDRWLCPYTGYMGPMGYEGHCESLIASGAYWDMATALRADLGDGAGFARAESIWFRSVVSQRAAYQVVSGGQCNPNATVNGCGATNWYNVFLAADDDDGDLANGTPNGCRIWSAFNDHGIACGSQPACYSACPTLGVPTLSKTEGHNQVQLSWTGVSGAASYQVYRNFVGCDRAFIPIATVTETSYLDTEVTDGFAVYYAVQAVGSNTSCRSAFSNCVTATPTPGGCPGCPNYDFGPYSPTLTYQTHSSTVPANCWKQYAFNLTAGYRYRFTFCEGGGTAGFDTVLALFNASCAAVAANDNSCGLLSQLDYTAPATGTYILRVRGSGGVSGAYTLAYRILSQPCDGVPCPGVNFGTFTPTTTYRTHSSVVDPDCYKTYRFRLNKNRTYRFTFCEGGGSAQFDTVLELYDPSCNLVASNDNYCDTGSQIDYHVPGNGYYILKVMGAGGAGGSYTLAYRRQ
jgi:hypothetical protein